MNAMLDELVEVTRESAADFIIEVLEPSPYKRRFVFRDKSFLDIYLSVSQKDIYAFHYERRHLDGTLYRVDNYPHHRAIKVKLFPHHFHDGSDKKVKSSVFGNVPDEILTEFLSFIRQRFFLKIGD